MRMDPCVCQWVAEERILSSALFEQCQIVWKVFLCLFWHGDHTKSWAWMNLRESLRLEVWMAKTKDVGFIKS